MVSIKSVIMAISVEGNEWCMIPSSLQASMDRKN